MSDSPYSGFAIKRSAGHFIIGKIASALLTFTLLLCLVRVLTIPDYAAYITLVAGLDIALIVANVGLPWIEARYLPEFRLHASKAILIRFVIQLIQCHVIVLLLLALPVWLSLDWLLLKMDMLPYLKAAQLYVIMLVIEGSGRSLRDSVLGALLQQGAAQISLVTRNLVFISALGVLAYQGEISLVNVITIELLAAFISVLVSLIGLGCHLRRIEVNENSDWKAPNWLQMWTVARDMYFSEMVTLIYSSQIFTLIIRYNLGAEATAVFGFLRNIYAQVMNYLPAALLFGLIRPKLVASYVGNGGIAELTRNANIVGKFSLFVLMPLLVFACLASEELITLLSGGKFSHSGYYLAGLLSALVPFSQRQLLETVAVVTENSHFCNYAALLGIFTLPITYALIQLGFDLWSPIISITLGNLIFCSTILIGVTRKTLYRADFLGFYKLLLAALISYLACLLILVSGQSWAWIITVALLTCSVFLLVAAIIKPFSDEERLRINQIIKRNLFVW